MTLQYTINKMLERHKLTIERDETEPDAFGAEPKQRWVVRAEVRGLFWWWPSHGAGRFKEHGDPERTVLTTGGGALVPLGTDVGPKDRVSKVLRVKDNVEIQGPFRIVSVRQSPTHIELSLERP